MVVYMHAFAEVMLGLVSLPLIEHLEAIENRMTKRRDCQYCFQCQLGVQPMVYGRAWTYFFMPNPSWNTLYIRKLCNYLYLVTHGNE